MSASRSRPGFARPNRNPGDTPLVSTPRAAITGLQALVEGMRLLRRERTLWPLAVAPVALAVAAVSIAATIISAYSAELFALLTDWMPVLEAGAWYTWIWIGPGKAVLTLVGWLFFAAASAAAVAAAFLCANVLAAPFLDALSRKTEELVSGSVAESGQSIWSEAWRSVVSELQRIVFFVSVWAVLTAVSFIVPGAQLVTPFILVGFTILFLPLEYSSYALDRRAVSFSERRSWIFGNLAMMVAFGSGAFVTFLIPGLNFLMIPTLVVAGTLLTLRRGPATATNPSSSGHLVDR